MSKDNKVEHELVSFSKNLTALRNQNGLSQENVANSTGISQSTLSGFESYYKHSNSASAKTPSLKQALTIAHHFNVGIGDMVDRDISTDTKNLEMLQPEEIHGARHQVSPLPLLRFVNTSFCLYYYSDTDITGKIRIGHLYTNHQCGKGHNFVSGHLKSEAQEYHCKVVIEHPSYIYIFGNNSHNPERLFIVLNEPRFTTRTRKYQCGVGLMISEGSSGNQFVQKVVVTGTELKSEHHEIIRKWLDMGDRPKFGYSLPKEEDKELYEWYKLNYTTR